MRKKITEFPIANYIDPQYVCTGITMVFVFPLYIRKSSSCFKFQVKLITSETKLYVHGIFHESILYHFLDLRILMLVPY